MVWGGEGSRPQRENVESETDRIEDAVTDLADRMMTDAGLSRPEQTALVIGRLAEQLPPGARIGTKRELQERCGVSKGTFNEALQILQARGVITLRSGPGGGLFAAKPTPIARLGNSILALDAAQADVSGAVRIRDALDPLLIDDALEYGSAADIARMRMSLDEMQAAIDADDPMAFVRANWDLHAAIARITPDTVLRTLYLSLLEVIESHTLAVEEATEKSLPEYIVERHKLHVELVEALDRRDRERARQLIAEHSTTK